MAIRYCMNEKNDKTPAKEPGQLVIKSSGTMHKQEAIQACMDQLV